MTFTPEPDIYFDHVPVHVDKVYAFGEGVAYVATFGRDMPRWQKERLDQYLKRLNEEKNRFFPDLPEAEPDPDPDAEPPQPDAEPAASEETPDEPSHRLDIEI